MYDEMMMHFVDESMSQKSSRLADLWVAYEIFNDRPETKFGILNYGFYWELGQGLDLGIGTWDSVLSKK